MKIHKCDLCGKFFNTLDEQEHFGLHYHNVGYGSKYDGCHIDIDMCCDCFDKMMTEYIEPKLKFKAIKPEIPLALDSGMNGVRGNYDKLLEKQKSSQISITISPDFCL